MRLVSVPGQGNQGFPCVKGCWPKKLYKSYFLQQLGRFLLGCSLNLEVSVSVVIRDADYIYF